MRLDAAVPRSDAPWVTLYDELDWHYDTAIEAGQPEENAFTHIGLYLAWLIRHDLHDPDLIPKQHSDALKRGEMTGSDLADDIDGKLVGDVSDSGEVGVGRPLLLRRIWYERSM